VTVLGIDPVVEPKLHDMPLTSGPPARRPGDTNSALITQTLADQEGLKRGDTVSLSGTREAGPQAYTIVGIVAGDGTLPEATAGW
jgi:ABC-type lipoprotein release transport system permease subunit